MNQSDNQDLTLLQDPVFKAVFTKDTAASREALHSLLSAFLEQELSEVTVISGEPAITDLRDRGIRYDFAVRFSGGKLGEVEMTMSPRRSEPQRIEYYLARLYINQDIRGEERSYKSLEAAYHLSFLNGNVIGDREWYHRFEYYDPERRVSLGGLTRIITVELGKLGEVVRKAAGEMTLRERWAVYLRYREEPGMEELIREILEKEGGIRMAEQTVMGITETEMENFRAMWRDIAELDRKEAILEMKEDAIAEGLAEGMTKGLAEGLAKGYERANLETARRMKARGRSLEEIAEDTGLSVEEVNGA